MKTKLLLIISLLLSTAALSAQSIKEMHPKLGKIIYKSKADEKEFERREKIRLSFIENDITEEEYARLSAENKEIYDNRFECDTAPGYWDVLGDGCSWYCGGGADSIVVSSSLKPTGNITYDEKNIFDLNYKTAWVEGVKGYGIGETITYYFRPDRPRVTDVIIVNGYVKSEKAWMENSRVKKLKMSYNGKPIAMLNLVDGIREQHFEFAPLGYLNQVDPLPTTDWTITFEIMEVYPGEKYDDTAITEIYLDGIDVH